MQTRTIAIRFTFAIALGITALGCSTSDPKNGTLVCATGTKPCPDGYLCSQKTNTCWKNGTLPSEDSGTTNSDTQPAGDTAFVPDLIGHDALSGNDQNTGDVAPADAAPLGDVASDGPGADVALPDASPDVALPDASPDVALRDSNTPDFPLSPSDTAPTCPSGKVICGSQCIDPPPVGCCAASDCTGTCMTCGADHTCVAAKNQDDPNKVCAGTCDASGVCKKKKGQSCQSTATDCVGGTTCSPDGVCCDSACTGTCEACDLAANPGTCTTLSAGTSPHKGHPACTATDAACAGTCNGASASCSYPTTACGTATCTNLVYLPKGACNAGACAVPTTQTCANLCSVTAGGCTGVCTPGNLQCSPSNVNLPQKCSADGAWQDQTPCGNGFTCSAGACACATPKSACGTSCLDLQGTDANNCGTCGHSCLSGTCAAGKCQPATVVTGVGDNPTVLGVDSQYVYYRATPNPGQPVVFSRVARTAVAGSGTALFTPGFNDTLYGVIGTSLVFKSYSSGNVSVCSIVNPASSTTSCATAVNEVPDSFYGHIIPWRSPSGSDFAYQNQQDGVNPLDIFWTSTSLASVKQVSDSDTSAYYGDFFVAQNLVYWISTSNNVTSLWLANNTPGTNNTMIATGLSGSLGIADANAQSVLLWDPNSGNGTIYRLAANTVASPTALTSMVTPPSTLLATEDASWVYWFDSTGNLSRCSPSSCASTKTVIATGQQPTPAGLYQDATALYWGNTSPAAIIRLAK